MRDCTGFGFKLTKIRLIVFTALLLHLGTVVVFSGIFSPRPIFWDMYGTITWGNCFRSQGFSVFQPRVAGNPCSGVNYGYLAVFIFALLSLFTQNYVALGVIAISFFFISFIKFVDFDTSSKRKSILILVFALSPPTFLLFSSANLDLILIILLILASYHMSRNRLRVAVLLYALATLLKFFVFPCMLIALLFSRNRMQRGFCLIIIALTSCAVLHQFIWNFYASPAGAQNSYGAKIVANYLRKLGFNVPDKLGYVLGIFILFAVVLIILRLSNPDHLSLQQITAPTSGHKNNSPAFFLYISAGLSLLFSYIVTLNVDYRLVLLSFVSIAHIRLIRKWSWLEAVFLGTSFISLYFSWVASSWTEVTVIDLQPIGDITLLLSLGVISVRLFHSLKLGRQRGKVE